MKFTILTLFPKMIEGYFNESILKRAKEKGLIEIKIVNIRDYTKDKYFRTDTPPVGGGAGLIMKCQPIIDALKANSNDKTYKIIMSPRGRTFNQKIANEFKDKYEDIKKNFLNDWQIKMKTSPELLKELEDFMNEKFNLK